MPGVREKGVKAEKESDPVVTMGFSVRAAIKTRDFWESLGLP